MRQFVIRALNLALVTACCFQSARVVNLIATDSLTPAPTYVAGQAPAAARPRAGWDARQAILERNLFGVKIASETVEVVEIVEEKVEETKLPLVLEATIAGAGSGTAQAAIHDTKSRTSMVLKVGDPLENYTKVTIASIERGRVVLRNGGRHEELLLDEGLGVSSIPSGMPTATSSSRSRASRSARRPSSRSRSATSAAAQRVRDLTESRAEGELTLEEITAEIQRMRDLE